MQLTPDNFSKIDKSPECHADKWICTVIIESANLISTEKSRSAVVGSRVSIQGASGSRKQRPRWSKNYKIFIEGNTCEGRMGARWGSESFETTMQVCDPFKKRLEGELGRKSLRLHCHSGDVWASSRELWHKRCWLRSHTLGRNVQVLVSLLFSVIGWSLTWVLTLQWILWLLQWETDNTSFPE